MGVKLPTYIQLDEAARRYGVSREALTRAIADGIMRAVRTPEGKIMVAEADVALPKRENFAHLTGRKLTINQAHRLYGISVPTLRSWIRQNMIRVYQQGSQGKGYEIDEADVAFWTAVYRYVEAKEGSVRGRRLKDLVPQQEMAVSI